MYISAEMHAQNSVKIRPEMKKGTYSQVMSRPHPRALTQNWNCVQWPAGLHVSSHATAA